MKTLFKTALAALVLHLSPALLAQDSGCNRTCLDAFIDMYFEAQAAHDPAALPLARGVKFTENGTRLPPGQGLWQTAGKPTYQLTIADPDQGTAAALVVMREHGELIMQMLRLKVAGGEIAEAETIVVRDGDSDPIWAPETLDGARPGPNFTLSIRPIEQNTRAELIAAGEAYWRAFETNGSPRYRRAPLLPTTTRTENGVRTTTATGVADVPPSTAAQGFDEGRYPNRRVFDRRYPVVDVERGVALSVARFGHQPGKLTPNIPPGDAPLVAEFFQVQSGRIVEIQVIMNFDLRETDPTGW